MMIETTAMLELDLKRNRARQYATMIVMELRPHISASSRGAAIYDLAKIFEKADVEITTAEERKLAPPERCAGERK